MFDESGGLQTGAATNRRNLPDWTRGLAEGPTARGFDYSFGHAASADIPPYNYFESGDWVTSESVWSPGASEFGVDFMRPGWRDPDWDPRTVTQTLTGKAVDYIEDRLESSDAPFFLNLSLPSPHSPTSPNPAFQGTTAGQYTDFLGEVDHAVGEVVGAIERMGALDDTLIIFTADNGASENITQLAFNNPTHRAAGYIDNVEARGQKFDAYEGGHRVPFIARWGAGASGESTVHPGVVTDELINLQDLYTTAAGLAGESLATDEGVDSYDILPALLGDGADLRIREANFSVSQNGVVALTRQDDERNEWKLIYSSGGGFTGGSSEPGGARIDENFVDVSPFLSRRMQLYNLTTDPGERSNLFVLGGVSAEEVALASQMRALMTSYITSGRSAPLLRIPEPNTSSMAALAALFIRATVVRRACLT